MEGPGAALNGNAVGGGNDTFRLAGSGSNSFNVSQIGPGFALLDKTGASNWTLTGTATYAGPVTVREGTLTVNGSLASASGISVAPGATLGGNGTLPATTISAGAALAPGNSIGTVTISGSLTFVGAGNYVVEVSPTAADRTNVTGAPGTATLSGTLQAIGTGGSYTRGQRYTVLNATGGISGTFGTLAISGNFGVTKPHIEYDASNVYLVLDLNQISPSLTNATANQRAVATAADAAVLAGVTSTLFGSLFNVPHGAASRRARPALRRGACEHRRRARRRKPLCAFGDPRPPAPGILWRRHGRDGGAQPRRAAGRFCGCRAGPAVVAMTRSRRACR